MSRDQRMSTHVDGLKAHTVSNSFQGRCTNESCLTHTAFSNSTRTQTTIFYSPPISQFEDSEPSISVTTANLVSHRKWYSEGRNATSEEV